MELNIFCKINTINNKVDFKPDLKKVGKFSKPNTQKQFMYTG